MVHYRVPLFERMHRLCAALGIQLDIVYGQPSAADELRGDFAELSCGRKIRNRYWSVFGRELVWQRLPENVYAADMVILPQENRILSNYPMLLRRIAFEGALAFWGHGRNFQSKNPSGFRERWKKATLNQVDWWFTYTNLSALTVKKNGVPEHSITVLNNSIDTRVFRDDLGAVTPEMLIELRRQYALDTSAPVGLYCGSLNSEKRLDVLVAASDKIRAAHPNFHLFVLGAGPGAPYITEAFRSRPGRHYIGETRGIKKASYFRLAQVILNPGLVGLSIVDAFCAGLPLVTMEGSKHSPEIAYLHNEVNGLMTEDSVDAYAERVIELFQQHQNRSILSANAAAAAEQYSIENMAENFVNGIAECLARRGKRLDKLSPIISDEHVNSKAKFLPPVGAESR
jgi:L-malate glycosyltransferase